MAPDIDPIEFGEHRGSISRLQEDMAHVKESLYRIEQCLAEKRGAWRMLVAVGAMGGAVGAGIAKIAARLIE